MPVAPNRTDPGRQALVIALAGLLGVAAIAFVVTRIAGEASSGDLQLDLGERAFTIGQAEDLAAKMDDEGVFGGDPLLIPGQGNDRDIWVQHIGDDPQNGWRVFGARPLSAPRSCVAEWKREDRQFVDSCDGTVYPADGEGLPQYPVEVVDGFVVATINRS